MSGPLSTLPQDLIDEIICRLRCVESIGRFRCVSKQWRSYLSSPQFVKGHLKNIDTEDPENLLCIAHRSLYVIDFSIKESINCDGVLRKIESPFEKGVDFEVGGCCNGLVLLVEKNYGDSKFLMNPITLEAEKVDDDSYDDRFTVFGLGYDESKDDYKIVSLVREYPFQDGYSDVDIYSFKTKSWRKISNFCPPVKELVYVRDTYIDRYAGVFVHGRIHWIAINGSSMHIISAFNLGREEFEQVLPPRAVESQFEIDGSEIRVLRGCLAVILDDGCNEVIDVWVMKEYGVRDSWTKLRFLTFCWYRPRDVVFLLHDYELVLKTQGEAFVAFDSRNGVEKNLVVANVPHSLGIGYSPKMASFRGSLVSPNYNYN